MAGEAEFTRRWLTANAVGFFVGYLLYTPIAHGVTGPHGRDLTLLQLVAHSIALAVVGTLVVDAQRRVLRPHASVGGARVVAAVVVFIIAFWAGYYQPVRIGPDADMMLGFFVLGTSTWPGTLPVRGHRVAAGVALVSFPLAGVLAEGVLVMAALVAGFTPDLQGSMIQHAMFWLFVGGTAGLLGGLVSGQALSQMLPTLPQPEGFRETSSRRLA